MFTCQKCIPQSNYLQQALICQIPLDCGPEQSSVETGHVGMLFPQSSGGCWAAGHPDLSAFKCMRPEHCDRYLALFVRSHLRIVR